MHDSISSPSPLQGSTWKVVSPSALRSPPFAPPGPRCAPSPRTTTRHQALWASWPTSCLTCAAATATSWLLSCSRCRSTTTCTRTGWEWASSSTREPATTSCMTWCTKIRISPTLCGTRPMAQAWRTRGGWWTSGPACLMKAGLLLNWRCMISWADESVCTEWQLKNGCIVVVRTQLMLYDIPENLQTMSVIHVMYRCFKQIKNNIIDFLSLTFFFWVISLIWAENRKKNYHDNVEQNEKFYIFSVNITWIILNVG